MKQQKVKFFAVVIAVWSIFCGPIIAQSISEVMTEEAIGARTEQKAQIDSLLTAEPPDEITGPVTQETPPGEIWLASYYSKRFNGKKTASGETYNQNEYTCAHKTLPFNTLLKITNPKNGKTVQVRVIDRGPFIRGRDLDLSYAAAKELGLLKHGVMKVSVEIIPETEENTQLTLK
ncbi:MAG: septal ring lytic transglycosylase RlpA family protein [Candidatus Cloacimonadaceae bacterium]|mgnify:CR=1 FL=1|jgi:rare lipoprotein A (peptidoglycan hydrolase)